MAGRAGQAHRHPLQRGLMGRVDLEVEEPRALALRHARIDLVQGGQKEGKMADMRVRAADRPVALLKNERQRGGGGISFADQSQPRIPRALKVIGGNALKKSLNRYMHTHGQQYAGQ